MLNCGCEKCSCVSVASLTPPGPKTQGLGSKDLESAVLHLAVIRTKWAFTWRKCLKVLECLHASAHPGSKVNSHNRPASLHCLCFVEASPTVEKFVYHAQRRIQILVRGGGHIYERDRLSSLSSMTLRHETSCGSSPYPPHNRDNPLST